MIPHVEPEREEDVVPDEHLHLGVFPRVDGHHIAIDDGHSSAGGRRHEVAVHLEDGALAEQSLGQVFAGQLAGRLQLLVPVARLARDVLLVAELRGERCRTETAVRGRPEGFTRRR